MEKVYKNRKLGRRKVMGKFIKTESYEARIMKYLLSFVVTELAPVR